MVFGQVSRAKGIGAFEYWGDVALLGCSTNEGRREKARGFLFGNEQESLAIHDAP